MARNWAATSESISMPYANANLKALPTSLALASATALAIFENTMGWTKVAVVAWLNLSVWASWESLIRPVISPAASIPQDFASSVADRRPWHPAGSGISMSLGKSTSKAWALKDSGESLCKDRASVKVTSRVSLRTAFDSFGNARRLTGTLKLEISWRSQLSSPHGA